MRAERGHEVMKRIATAGAEPTVKNREGICANHVSLGGLVDDDAGREPIRPKRMFSYIT